MRRDDGRVDGWLRPGARWFVRMADFDAADDYRIDVVDGAELTLRWGFAPDDEDDDMGIEGTGAFAAAALADGDGVLFLSQGGASARDDDAASPFRKHTPPFLVSRDLAARLAAGDSARVTVYGEDAEVEKVGDETRTLVVDGAPEEVAVIRASGGDVTLWIALHDRFPLLLRAEFQGDNEIELTAVRAP